MGCGNHIEILRAAERTVFHPHVLGGVAFYSK